MNVYVVNLKRRPDRRRRMEQSLPAEWNAEYTTYWPGPLDGRDIDPDQLGFGLFPWEVPSENPWWSRALKLGEIGCAVSHWMCWTRADQAGSEHTLILEDDAVLTDSFSLRLRARLATLETVDPYWDLLYLGRWTLGKDQPVARGIVRPGYSYCTFAYMLSAPGLQKVLAARFEHDLIPVDELLSALHMDHPRPDVRLRYPRCMNAYALEPPLVTQLPKEEGGSDTEHSRSVRGVDTEHSRSVRGADTEHSRSVRTVGQVVPSHPSVGYRLVPPGG